MLNNFGQTRIAVTLDFSDSGKSCDVTFAMPDQTRRLSVSFDEGLMLAGIGDDPSRLLDWLDKHGQE